MDVHELAKSLQALIDAQRQQRPANPKPEPQDVLLVPAPEPDPYEHLFRPADDYTAAMPATSLNPEDPYGVFDDHLLDHIERTGDVRMTTSSHAAYRAKRTGVQGLIATILVAVGGVLTSLTVGAEIDWKLLGLSLGQAILTAIISYLHKDNAAPESE